MSFCCNIADVKMTVFLALVDDFYNMLVTCCVLHVVFAGYPMLINTTLTTSSKWDISNTNIVATLHAQ